MTQEDKELLLKDISGRLPYCPIVQISLYRNDGRKRDLDLDPHVTENIWELIDKYHALPYLRPMSSMTEEEKKEYASFVFEQPFLQKDKIVGLGSVPMCIDWLNSRYLDYRGLIEKGLAIAVTEDNNPYKV